MPSGDLLVQFRVVVPRPARRRAAVTPGGTAAATGAKSAGVDTIDVACWTARTRTAAARLADGDQVEVTGSLRRRFFNAGPSRASRYEVEAARVARARAAPPGRPPAVVTAT